MKQSKYKEIRAIDRLKSEPSPLNWSKCWCLTEISVKFKPHRHLLVAVASMASKVSDCDHSFNPVLISTIIFHGHFTLNPYTPADVPIHDVRSGTVSIAIIESTGPYLVTAECPGDTEHVY